MIKKTTVAQLRQRIARDLAMQLLKNRGILNNPDASEQLRNYARGGMATARQLIKWQIWSDFSMRDLIVAEYRRCLVAFPPTP